MFRYHGDMHNNGHMLCTSIYSIIPRERGVILCMWSSIAGATSVSNGVIGVAVEMCCCVVVCVWWYILFMMVAYIGISVCSCLIVV